MKKIFLFFFLFTRFLFAGNSIERTIESISYKSQVGSTVGFIKLTDGSVWKWIPDTYSENLLRKWAEGDEIIIQTVNHPGFVLQNLSHPHFTPIVALTFNSYRLFPSILSLDPDNNIITLSDGSKWEVIYDFNKRTLYHWEKEDRIIAVKSVHENYQLINLDIPYDHHGQVERSVEVFLFKLPDQDYSDFRDKKAKDLTRRQKS